MTVDDTVGTGDSITRKPFCDTAHMPICLFVVVVVAMLLFVIISIIISICIYQTSVPQLLPRYSVPPPVVIKDKQFLHLT